MSRARGVAATTVLNVALASLLTAAAPSAAPAQTGSGWRAPAEDANSRYGVAAPQEAAPAPAQPIPPAVAGGMTAAPAPIRAQVSKGSGTLPNEHGQVWREYDITPYTIRNTTSVHPEQAIVDWILRETGYEAWHSIPVGLLSADRKVLRVYHTPQMQATVGEIVDRFVSGQASNYGFGIRVITMKNPNWRIRALPLMTSIPVQSPGVQGWILAKEDAALLLGEFRRRTDFREQTTPSQMVLNGQTMALSTMRPITYTKGIVPLQNVWPGYQPELGSLDEGFSLEFSPLLSPDGRTTDAVVKLKLCQVEKMLEVQLETPTAVAQNQHASIQVPQLTMIQLHERFRWPTDQVLLLSMGVVATPGPEKPNVLADLLPMGKAPPRADALLMVESRGTVSQAAPVPGSAAAPLVETATMVDRTFHGRY
ncbi:MAG TPA: hypothetical protein VEQ85_02925 [Lacipirellulaceae bacterium]|nr:hypothetical protein [Lacipirellulaceae bacterium]